jgi:hypothetical protein
MRRPKFWRNRNSLFLASDKSSSDFSSTQEISKSTENILLSDGNNDINKKLPEIDFDNLSWSDLKIDLSLVSEQKPAK